LQVPNACGTVGILHALANASTLCGGSVELREGSWLDRFLRRSLPLDADARAAALEADVEVEAAHSDVVQEGQSAVVDDTWQHFIAFVPAGGRLWELDGRKATPIDAGPTQPGSLLVDACAAVQRFMDRDPGELRFTMVVLGPAGEEEEEEGEEDGS
jgi:ubiquitin carboxyl-terminal hydrolase L3